MYFLLASVTTLFMLSNIKYEKIRWYESWKRLFILEPLVINTDTVRVGQLMVLLCDEKQQN